MPPYPPKPLAGYVLGKGYEKKGKREKKPPGKNRSLTPSRGLHLSWNVFIKLFPLAGGPASRRFHPSIPVVYPSGRIDKGCLCWCSKGNGFVELGRALRRGLAYRCIPQRRGHHFPTNSEQSPELRLRQKDSITSRSGIANSVGSHSL
jgi:hypothetical protein